MNKRRRYTVTSDKCPSILSYSAAIRRKSISPRAFPDKYRKQLFYLENDERLSQQCAFSLPPSLPPYPHTPCVLTALRG